MSVTIHIELIGWWEHGDSGGLGKCELKPVAAALRNGAARTSTVPGVSASRCVDGEPTIEAQGLARRTNAQKWVVQFRELIGNESTHHLRYLLLYNSGIQDNQVEDEFESHVGLHAKYLKK